MLITMMIIAHFSVDGMFRKIVFSFHMMAFVFFSGYCFKPEAANDLRGSVLKLLKHFLIPYGIFGVFYVIKNHYGYKSEIMDVLFGISFSNKLFVDFRSVGPVYFILLLFLVRVLYLLIERCMTDDLRKSLAVLALSILGKWLGDHGFWLPWSLDCALYSLIVYHIGYCFRKYDVIAFLKERPYFYFAISSIWAYMIYRGGMEIAVRNYGEYGVVVFGAVSGTVLLYFLCNYLCTKAGNFLITPLKEVGKSTVYILIIHALFGGTIINLFSAYFESGYIYNAAASTITQLLLGVSMHYVSNGVKNGTAGVAKKCLGLKQE